MMKTHEAQWLSTPAVAGILGVDLKTIRTLVMTGDLPAIRLGERGRIRIAKTDFETWLQSRRVKPGDTAAE